MLYVINSNRRTKGKSNNTDQSPVSSWHCPEPANLLLLLLHLVSVEVVEEEELLLGLGQVRLGLRDGLDPGISLHQLVLPEFIHSVKLKIYL